MERVPAALSARSPHDTVAHADYGHWKRIRGPGKRERLQAIEAEELQHRAWTGEMPDHECYSWGKALSHSLGRILPLRTLPPPKENIRRKWEPNAKDKSGVA